MNVQVLLAAAGMGTRLGAAIPKALVEVAGKPLVRWTLERLEPLHLDLNPVVLIPSGYVSSFEKAILPYFPSVTFVEGGAERQLSVSNGLAQLSAQTDIVVIHDAARPFVPLESVKASIHAAAAMGAATVTVPVIDTILQADENAFLVETPDRRYLWACQTPQTFRVDVIRRAHASAAAEGFLSTDDASLVRRMGEPVKLVMGSTLNIKITTPVDLSIATCLIREGLV